MGGQRGRHGSLPPGGTPMFPQPHSTQGSESFQETRQVKGLVLQVLPTGHNPTPTGANTGGLALSRPPRMEPSRRDAAFHPAANPSPAWASTGGQSPARGPAERLLPSALNICTPPNFPSKRTVLFRGLNARIMRMSSTSRQPDVGRERQGRAGQGVSITPGPNVRQSKAPSASGKPRLFIPKSRTVIPINPVWGVGFSV